MMSGKSRSKHTAVDRRPYGVAVARTPFGAVLKRYRVAAGLAQEAPAERARLSTRGISDLERGRHRLPYRLSLQGRPEESIAPFIAAFTGSHRYVLGYLMDDVLLRQPEAVQTFVLHTCILG
jgi:transcriptional regulator with XRE-family HTH domain